LSPGKTVEGALGSIVGGWLGAAIIIFLVAPLICELPIQKHWWWFLVYGAVVTLFGILGDLAESLLKRDAEIKDSSSWIPGMGGFLDVVDSLVFTAPVSYFLWLLGDLPAAN
jgi:phosphatidate cytidylyltransferase